jgi:wyosine [tRNA(Phe)-imidazoG37] synthetase (radical SAM superfamily)
MEALSNRQVAIPVHVRVKPTNVCNHNCWYCAYRTDDLALGGEMVEKDSIPEQRMLALAREFVEIGVKAVTFSGGGEPLLYKPLPDVIEILAAGGVRVAALSNGSNLKGRVADVFAQHGTWIRISLEAWDNESYTKSRGAKPNDFSRLLDNMREFSSRDTKCVLGVSLIVGQDNAQHVAEICALMKGCGANHVKVSGAVVSNDAAGNNAYHLPIKDEVARQITQAMQLGDSRFSVINHYHELERRFDKVYTWCPFLQFLTVVGADQYVYTCQDKAYTDTGRMGSIAERSFKDFWFSVENQRFLYEFNPSVSCAHHCVSHTKNLAMHDYLSLDKEHSYFV